MINRKKVFTSIVTVLSVCMLVVFASGCSTGTSSSEKVSSGKQASDTSAVKVKIGTMPTEDFLPMWAASADGLFEAENLDVELITFDSAQSLSAAIASSDVDMAMVDVMRAIKLCESGTSVEIDWVTLGTEAEQGAFGVLAPADASYSTLTEFANAVKAGDELACRGIGVAANTVPEYVFEKLCEQEGVNVSDIPVQEVASLPERYSLMASDNLGAAALPASLLSLGEVSGMKLLAVDTLGANVSQSVMVSREEFDTENPEAVLAVAKVWDEACDNIANAPQTYMDILVENANLNSAVIDTYEVCTYPHATSSNELVRIEESLVAPQIEWMKNKGYATKVVSYNASDGSFVLG